MRGGRAGTRLIVRLRGRARARLASWARQRQGEDRLPTQLASRRVYILPTRAGLGFAALVFLMLLAGLNYANSLALFLAFLLAAVGLVAMYHCQRNLAGLGIAALTTGPAFAGREADVSLVLQNPGGDTRFALRAEAGGASAACESLAPGAQVPLRMAVRCVRRGRFPLGPLRLATTHPLGLFRAWTWLHVPAEILVYPAPRGTRHMPAARGPQSTRSPGIGDAGQDEWIGLRPFREGDSPRQIAWKSYARGAPLLTKEYRAAAGGEHLFEFAAIPGLDPEARLGQLARWIVAAEAGGERYGLILPTVRLEPHRGPAHRHRCLAALALYGLPA